MNYELKKKKKNVSILYLSSECPVNFAGECIWMKRKNENAWKLGKC